MPNAQLRILLVDDDDFVRSAMRDVVKQTASEAQVWEAEDGRAVLSAVRELEFDLVFLDLLMPQLSGLDVLAELRTKLPRAHIVVVTSLDVMSLREEAIARGASTFIAKPFHPLEIAQAIARAAAA